jgi:hypothetical protein
VQLIFISVESILPPLPGHLPKTAFFTMSFLHCSFTYLIKSTLLRLVSRLFINLFSPFLATFTFGFWLRALKFSFSLEIFIVLLKHSSHFLTRVWLLLFSPLVVTFPVPPSPQILSILQVRVRILFYAVDLPSTSTNNELLIHLNPTTDVC